MKELSIEQKAKRYDEAIAHAKNLLKTIGNATLGNLVLKNEFKNMFPALEEDEDEEIREWIKKELVSKHVVDNIVNDVMADKALAWLEKRVPIDEEKILIGARKDEDERIRKNCIHFLELQKQHHAATFEIEECIAWLEKQGEPIKIKKGKNYLCTKTHKYAGLEWIEGVKYYSPEDYSLIYKGCTCYCPKYSKEEHNNFFKEVELKKVEPKFKVGDWCIDNEDGTIFQIVKVLDNTYTYKTNEGKEYSCTHYSLENDARLWSIKDAKAGDVLATLNHILIFEKILPKDGGVSYCHYDFGSSTPQFDFNRDGGWYFGKEAKVYPATKEQRDALMKAMAEAGYTFDFEKKELKKIEQVYDVGADTQKSVEWEPQTGDTFRKKGTTSPTYHLCEKQEDSIIFSFVENREVGISGGEITLFALKQDYELVERPKSIEDVVEEELNKALQTKVEQKSVWGEEDEEIARALNDYVKNLDTLFSKINIGGKDVLSKEFREKVQDWLKSIKDRVQPQPKQEWSEEDEKMINKICQNLYDYPRIKSPFDDESFNEAQKEVQFIKSLRPQNNITDEELAQAKKDAYNDALDKIEYHSGEPTFDDGWHAAIDCILKNSIIPHTTWKPTEAQLTQLGAAVSKGRAGYFNNDVLRELYEQLKQL